MLRNLASLSVVLKVQDLRFYLITPYLVYSALNYYFVSAHNWKNGTHKIKKTLRTKAHWNQNK